MTKSISRNSLNGRSHLFTSESVTIGHPDKVADQISDSILDAIIVDDPHGRVACETLVTTGMVIVAGEITTSTYIDIPVIVRRTLKKIGYIDPHLGFDCENCAVITAIKEQSADIAMGVEEDTKHHKEQGAGDQGLMFGYACRETPAFMPMPIFLAHAITDRLARMRQSGKLKWLRPDGKSQVTVEYDDRGRPERIHTVVVSTQHTADITRAQLRKQVIDKIIMPVLPKKLVDKNLVIHVNPTGRFVIGGPKGDCGLTGRKIIVDTYGGKGSHGGGAFSGKDPSKVDRTASYMARYIAKNIVAADLADECEVQLSYAIGLAEPISVLVDTRGTWRIDEQLLEGIVRKLFPLKPKAMIKYLNLLRPIYARTARNGHFGRNHPDFTWERTDMTGKLRKAAGLKTKK